MCCQFDLFCKLFEQFRIAFGNFGYRRRQRKYHCHTGLYYDGYDTEITFNREDVQEPLVEMDEQLCASTATAFGTIYGDGKLLMNQPTAYTSYFSTNENFVLQYGHAKREQ